MGYGEPMGAGKTAGSNWRQTPVLIRSDIIAAAEREHLDISDECNRALAKRLGIGYQPLQKIPIPGGTAGDCRSRCRTGRTIRRAPAAPPVINAEDPTVPGKVMREKKERKTPGVITPQTPPQERPAAPRYPCTPGSACYSSAKDRAERQKRGRHQTVREYPDRTGDRRKPRRYHRKRRTLPAV